MTFILPSAGSPGKDAADFKLTEDDEIFIGCARFVAGIMMFASLLAVLVVYDLGTFSWTIYVALFCAAISYLGAFSTFRFRSESDVDRAGYSIYGCVITSVLLLAGTWFLHFLEAAGVSL